MREDIFEFRVNNSDNHLVVVLHAFFKLFIGQSGLLESISSLDIEHAHNFTVIVVIQEVAIEGLDEVLDNIFLVKLGLLVIS